MKSTLLVAAILGSTILVSCGSQRNFKTRKYTKGRFRIENKHLKNDRSENAFEDEVLDESEILLTESKAEETSPTSHYLKIVEEKANGEREQIKDSPTEYNLDPVAVKQISHQQQPRSQISEQKSDKKSNSKNDLSIHQKQARSSLIFGIVGLTLAIGLLALAIFAAPVSSPFLFFYLGRAIRIALIPSMFGVINSIRAKLGNENLGKYESARKAGFWLSISTIILWVLLF
jgi:hypothetical protein